MKTTMNLTTLSSDTGRFRSQEDLRSFFRGFGCAGLEVMPCDVTEGTQTLPPTACKIIAPDMVVGVHACCINDWIHENREFLTAHYRKYLDYARNMGAEYVVFHVTQVDEEESFTYRQKHTDEEVVLAACELINALLDNQGYQFHFLMENLWWSGLNFKEPSITKLLLDGVHYEKKALLLDTGHFLHTNHSLGTQKEALDYLNGMLDCHQELIPYIKGIHLQQSLTGGYVKEWLKQPHTLSADPMERFAQVYEHIFAIDRHLPFTEPGVKELIARINPLYVTYEYISRSREELAEYLRAGSRIFTITQEATP